MHSSITVDIGTTSVKLCAFDAADALLASTSHPTPTVRDELGVVYDVEALAAIVTDFSLALDPADRARVRRLAIAGVGESGGLVRSDISLASPMILWHDHRGADRLDALSDADRLRLYEITGLPVNANYALSKVAWAVEREVDDSSDAQWLNVGEYLAALLTGCRWSEYSLASRTMALDLSTRAWSPDACAMVGLDVARFPDLRTAREGSPITADRARALGLSTDVVVHVAGHDHMVGGVGADLRQGELLNSTGTTEGLLFLRDSASADARTAATQLANGISCTGDEYTLFASIPTGGSAFATLQSMLGVKPDALAPMIADLHARHLAGNIDLDALPVLLPRFRGSPPPRKSATPGGAMAGLRSDTSAADIVFACFAGMVLQFRDVLDLFAQHPDRIKVIGPAGRNPLWLQLKADLLGSPLTVSRFPQVVSRGAHALASGQAGSWAAAEVVEVEPDPDRHERLVEWADAVRPVWELLKGLPT